MTSESASCRPQSWYVMLSFIHARSVVHCQQDQQDPSSTTFARDTQHLCVRLSTATYWNDMYVLPSIGHSFHSRSGIRDVVVREGENSIWPDRWSRLGRRSGTVQTDNPVGHTKYHGRTRGMVVDEGGRPTGVLLYQLNYIYWQDDILARSLSHYTPDVVVVAAAVAVAAAVVVVVHFSSRFIQFKNVFCMYITCTSCTCIQKDIEDIRI